MNKEFITQATNTLSVKEFYYVVLGSSAKLNEDLHTKLDKYKESEAVREQLDLAQAVVDLSFHVGVYVKLSELLIDALDVEGGKEDPSDKQFSEWIATDEIGYKVKILLELLQD